jgi:uncharacterized protein involved in exopolysaccharide biosynthesis
MLTSDTELDDVTHPVEIVNLVLAVRHRLLVAVLLSVGLTAAVLLSFGREWQSSSSFSPKASKGSAGNLSGIAAQFGLAVPAGEATQSPAFYADLLTSKELLSTIVEANYVIVDGRDTVRGTLSDILHAKGANEALRREDALRALSGNVVAVPAAKTGVVRLTVTADFPDLAYQINRNLLQQLDSFNLIRRQSQAATERRFAGDRVGDARKGLAQSEERLESFLQRNREYRNESSLGFERERLNRDVNMQQQVYTSLVLAFEQARLDEVRDTPLLTVIEHPSVPVLPKSRRLAVKLVVAAFLAALIVVLMEGLRRYLAGARSAHPQDFAEFDRLRTETRPSLRRIFGLG